MTTKFLLLGLLSLAPVAGLAAPAKDAAPAVPAPKPAPTALQVIVNVPPTMRPWLEDDVAQAFADRVAGALREQGLKGPVTYLARSDKVDADRPLLEVSLIEWRTDRVGMVDCTFAATLSSPKGRTDLGVFTGTSMMMFSRRDWFARADQFEDAAREALDNLYQRIAATRLLSAGAGNSA